MPAHEAISSWDADKKNISPLSYLCIFFGFFVMPDPQNVDESGRFYLVANRVIANIEISETFWRRACQNR